MTNQSPSIQTFIKNLERQFEELTSDALTSDTLFRNLPGWTSLQALVVIISFDEEYGVIVSSEELQNSQTIGDLYSLVVEKQSV